MAHERQLILGDATSTRHRLGSRTSHRDLAPRARDALARITPGLVFSTTSAVMVALVVAVSRGHVSALSAAAAIVSLTAATTLFPRRHQRRQDQVDTHADIVGMLGARVAAAEAAQERREEILHELKATVGGVAMASRLLTDHGGRLAEATVSRLEDMRHSELDRLQRLLSEESSPVGPVDLDHIARPLVTSLAARGHDVAWTRCECRALGRPDDMAEILHILLENAVRHGAGRDIRLVMVDDGDRIQIAVSDAGPGVPADLRARIFDRGERAPTSPGQGIGLHAARRLAVEMGGDLRLDSRHDRSGASFVLELPADPGHLCHARSA